MDMVGKVGSFFTTPFHPFGGAVDIIVVKQQDGAFRSTPWYVRFGKFQGVLKGAEKVVRIEVNGVEADFHMYLDSAGEAYFVREDNSDKDKTNEGLKDSDILEGTSESNDTDHTNNDNTLTDNSFHRQEAEDLDNSEIEVRDERVTLGMDRLERTESDNERMFYGFQDEQSSQEGSSELSEYGSSRYDNLDSVEHLIESENLNSEVVLVSVDGHILTAPISSSERHIENVQENIPQFQVSPDDGTEEFNKGQSARDAGYLSDEDTSKYKVTSGSECKISNSSLASKYEQEPCEGDEEHLHHRQETQDTANQDRKLCLNCNSENTSSSFKRDEVFKSCLELPKLAMQPINADQQNTRTNDESEEGNLQKSRNDNGLSPSDSGYTSNVSLPELQVQVAAHEKDAFDHMDSDSTPAQDVINDQGPEKQMDIDVAAKGMQSVEEAPTSVDECSKTKDIEPATGVSIEEMRTYMGTRLEISLCGNLLYAGMSLSAAAEAFDTNRISAEELKLSAASIVKNENLIVRIRGKYVPWDKAAPIILGLVAYGLDLPVQPGDAIPVEQGTPETKKDDSVLTSTPSGSRWRLWPIPFRKVKTLEQSGSNSSNEEIFVDSESVSTSQPVELTSTPPSASGSPRKQLTRTNVPTTDQIASLNLKEGQNMVNFIFSTRVLGSQKVEAHIYLWKWNTRIVISDVDGTITKSDVLGQFMPLVGKDWTHSGIARLFCAIKENGYQLLFLSARAIVQSYLTKSFLFNLKQDGKSLPTGPVVISPDGLFPSLYREVIRRAPHEFKIACLEDIKALFPPEYNPFYAGFGNRDTDELSYRKMGIPKGKIFIINPKGEVAINHRIDVRSYTSLHTLVHDMFPSTSLVEQEDYNSWNYWKMPMPSIDDF
ncbi:Phosphatidate phosphatase PAH1 [Abeliophyllum distichum]|uniref:phosphatidate phosphatase n=1 Tax=Abeliophyllum distichum TaxID=126358 RepID=A0ABD1QZ56_9LAMI